MRLTTRIIILLTAIVMARFLASCGGDVAIEEGPALKEVLDTKRAEQEAKSSMSSLERDLDSCGYAEKAGLSLVNKSQPSISLNAVAGIAPKTIVVEAQTLNASEVQVLVDRWEGSRASSALLIRANCFSIKPGEVFDSRGRDLYIVANKVTLSGEIKTLNADMTRRGGRVRLAALKLDLGAGGSINSGALDREQLLKLVHDQAYLGMHSWTADELAGEGISSIENRSQNRIVRGIHSKKPFDVEGSSARKSDAEYIFEARLNQHPYVVAYDAGHPDAVYDSGRDEFGAALNKLDYVKTHNWDDWSLALSKITELVKTSQTSAIANYFGGGVPEFAEEVDDENLKQIVSLNVELGGAVEVYYVIGSSSLRPMTRVSAALGFSGAGAVVVMRSRTIRTHFSIQQNGQEVVSLPAHLRDSVETISVPTTIHIQSVTISGVDVRQDLDAYHEALSRWGVSGAVIEDSGLQSKLRYAISKKQN